MSFRLRAFLVHLGISFTVAVVSLIVVFCLWHPLPLAKAVGVTRIFLLLLAIDTVLGPVLTFLVAKKGKRTLRTDLAVIALLQASAYCYGMYHIAEGRPAWIAFDTSRFELVTANAVDMSSAEIPADYRHIPWLAPRWVAVRPPAGDKEKSGRLFYELDEGFPPAARPALYEPLDDARIQIAGAAHPVAELKQYNPGNIVEQVLAEYPQADGYIPLLAPETDMAVLVNTREKTVGEIVDLRPWR